MANIPITPVQIVKTIDSFLITAIRVKELETAIIYLDVYDSNNVILESRLVQMSAAEYAAWGQSDQYVIDLVMAFYGWVAPQMKHRKR
jgi:hypothetical protein